MKSSRTSVLVIVAALGAACGDDPAVTSQTGEPITSSAAARKQCDQLVQTMCNAFAACLVRDGEISSSERGQFTQVCHDQFADEEFCDDVTAVGASYQRCLADINRESCFDPGDLPSSCEGAVLS